MKKLSFLFLLLCFNVGVYSEANSTELEKYNKPANISQLDWKLLKIQVTRFSETLKWDDFGLITSIDLSSIKNPAKILFVFTVDNSKYFKLTNDVLEKVFKNAVEGAHKIIKISIPEADLEDNIHAIFLTVGSTSKTIAEYSKGNINLIK